MSQLEHASPPPVAGTQVGAVLHILRMAVADGGATIPSAALVGDALWAASELIGQAEIARDQLAELRDKAK